MAADARRWAARGFGTFKLKVGAGDDVAQVRAVREALGPEAKLRLDANGAWSVAEALGVLRMVEPLDVELVEQPVAELRELAEVSAGTSIPSPPTRASSAARTPSAPPARATWRP